MMLSRGGSSLLSPRGMMRGGAGASAMPLMGRGSPAKASPAWGGRNSRQMYGRPSFLRGYVVIPNISLILLTFCANVVDIWCSTLSGIPQAF